MGFRGWGYPISQAVVLPSASRTPVTSSLCPRFPFSRPELLKEWVLNIGRGDFEPKQHTVICSEHFRPECFSAFGNRKNLKHNAVPTEFTFQGPPQVRPVGGGRAGPGRGQQPGQSCQSLRESTA